MALYKGNCLCRDKLSLNVHDISRVGKTLGFIYGRCVTYFYWQPNCSKSELKNRNRLFFFFLYTHGYTCVCMCVMKIL